MHFIGTKLMEQNLINQLKGLHDKTKMYEDEDNQKLALSYVPLDKLNITEEQIKNHTLDSDEMIDIVHWFKTEFFHWIEDHCIQCGSKELDHGSVQPTEEDLIYSAQRVEVFKCRKCGYLRRFPRYNNPMKLLETRVGRCGEYANVCFIHFSFNIFTNQLT